MVKVYKTNIRKRRDADRMLDILSHRYPLSGINFDLEDADNILRIESISEYPHSLQIEKIVLNEGYWIEELEHYIPS